MGRLIYTAIASLDGYVNDERGEFGWAAPDEQVHRDVNDHERGIGTYLLGRRMYEVLSFWETASFDGDDQRPLQDYAEIWRGVDKVVYSTTLDEVPTARTRLVRQFDPAEVASLKTSSERDLSIGGPGLAAAGLAAGLVDEIALYLVPVSVGGGTPALPERGLRLELLEQRRFDAGTVFLRYAVHGPLSS